MTDAQMPHSLRAHHYRMPATATPNDAPRYCLRLSADSLLLQTLALQCVRQLFHLAVVEVVIETAVAALLCYEIAEAGKLTASIDQAHTG